jgi:hypothetical protein
MVPITIPICYERMMLSIENNENMQLKLFIDALYVCMGRWPLLKDILVLSCSLAKPFPSIKKSKNNS